MARNGQGGLHELTASANLPRMTAHPSQDRVRLRDSNSATEFGLVGDSLGVPGPPDCKPKTSLQGWYRAAQEGPLKGVLQPIIELPKLPKLPRAPLIRYTTHKI
ncbi:hypothetical protein PSTG_16737 [Puccinia striiformis f. sp. tritici PST-78]|uniref:Uncharacterized protein n=1 Tax=Puccinia striiformis f. sp. tritici PST-78 TaxID=1165861 RepID=A0A0L0USA9_9BASI|nr:hypothetical protein PSTG_16737 [Puccinia striiformis f. sp. tritici PST-78]